MGATNSWQPMTTMSGGASSGSPKVRVRVRVRVGVGVRVRDRVRVRVRGRVRVRVSLLLLRAACGGWLVLRGRSYGADASKGLM